MDRLRKICCISFFGFAALAAAAAAAGAARPIRPSGIERARLRQAGRDLIATFNTARPVPLARLEPEPKGAGAFLCLELRQAGSRGQRRLCLGGPHGRRSLGLQLVNAAGRVTSTDSVPARVKRPDPGRLVVALRPAAAGLRPHRYRWRVRERAGPCQEPGADCEESWPGNGLRTFRLRPVRAVGCTGGTAGLDTNGPRDENAVALTFDDGPSEYTPGFLNVLREKHAVGTFFEIGQEMAGRERTMRSILAEGSEIGDHTMHHTFFPGYAEIAPAADLIDAATHFRPCLFRPPGGGVNASVIDAAAEAGMRTITWDVDPRDWTDPGSGAVYSRVVGAAQPGSIILMHDGGGDRSGTLAALPAIIDTLRGRGLRFETVTQLLGHRMIYRPYG